MNIAMDFDDTYTSDPRCMRAIIRCFQSCGHKVYIVTMRSREYDFLDEFDLLLKEYDVETIFCDGHAKKPIMEGLGIPIQFWMDDKPEGVNNPSAFTGSDLDAWRAEQKKTA